MNDEARAVRGLLLEAYLTIQSARTLMETLRYTKTAREMKVTEDALKTWITADATEESGKAPVRLEGSDVLA